MKRTLIQTRTGRLWLLLAGAVAVRAAFYTGFALGDDVFYVSAAAALLEGAGWPPLPLHWHTRLGMTVPTAAAVAAFDWHPFAFVWLPFVASLLGVWLCFHIVEQVVGTRAAWLAALLQAVFPLEVLYSTHLFPDIVVGNLAAVAVWLWVVTLRTDSRRTALACGAVIAAGYLCRETMLMLGPVFLGLWLALGRRWRIQLLWVGLLPVLLVLVESTLYAYATGDFFYRWRAIAAQQRDPSNLAAIASSAAGGGFWTDPLLMLITSHEFGVAYFIALPLAVRMIRTHPQLRWVSVWLLVGLVWLYYGTTIPTAWVPVQRDPRYAAPFTIPALLIIAVHVVDWPKWRRVVTVGILVGFSFLGASLDQRGTQLSAHRAFVRTGFAASASVEPFEYFGARWEVGLRSPVPFACAADAGRQSVVSLARALPGATVVGVSDRRYFVFSPSRRPDLSTHMAADGWRPVAEITGGAPGARRLLASLLQQVPSQRDRAARLAAGPRLVILEKVAGASLENPATPKLTEQ